MKENRNLMPLIFEICSEHGMVPPFTVHTATADCDDLLDRYEDAASAPQTLYFSGLESRKLDEGAYPINILVKDKNSRESMWTVNADGTVLRDGKLELRAD